MSIRTKSSRGEFDHDRRRGEYRRVRRGSRHSIPNHDYGGRRIATSLPHCTGAADRRNGSFDTPEAIADDANSGHQALRPNPVAEFELRVGDLRVLYNVEGSEAVLLIVGKKVGNKLVVEGEEFHGHQDDLPESTGGGPAQDAQ